MRVCLCFKIDQLIYTNGHGATTLHNYKHYYTVDLRNIIIDFTT